MRLLSRLGAFLSGDWWKGLAVITSAAGIVVGTVLTFGIFRLTESNVDLARSRETPELAVTGEAYIPAIEGQPQFEGRWLVSLSIVNYGPAPAAGFRVEARLNDQLTLDQDTMKVFDPSLGEITNPFLASATLGEGPSELRPVRVDVTVLRQGETLDLLVAVVPTETLSRYARFLEEGHSLRQLEGTVPYVSSGSLSGDLLDLCVFVQLLYRGGGNVSIFPDASGYRELVPSTCP